MRSYLTKTSLFLLLLLPLACSSHDEVFIACQKMARSHDHEQLLKHLEEANIPFQVGDENWILCRPKDREKVSELGRHILGITQETEVSGASASAKDSPEIAAALVRAKIPFEVIPNSEGTKFTFTWSVDLNSQAMAIVTELVD